MVYDEYFNVCPACGTSVSDNCDDSAVNLFVGISPTSEPPVSVEPSGKDLSRKKRKSRRGRIIAVIIIALVIAAGIITAVLLISSKHKADELAEQISLGEKYLSEEKYDEAIVALRRAIEIDPDDASLYQKLADAYIGKKDYDSAVRILEEGYDRTKNEDLQRRLNELGQLIKDGNQSDWKLLYKELMINRLLDENTTLYDPAFELVDIDRDGVPELILSDGTSGMMLARMYYIADGKVESAGASSYGEMQVCVNEHMFYTTTPGNAREESYYRKNGNEITKECTFFVSTDRYTMNDMEITREEYETEIEHYKSLEWKRMGRKNKLTASNLDTDFASYNDNNEDSGGKNNELKPGAYKGIYSSSIGDIAATFTITEENGKLFAIEEVNSIPGRNNAKPASLQHELVRQENGDYVCFLVKWMNKNGYYYQPWRLTVKENCIEGKDKNETLILFRQTDQETQQ